MGLYIGIGNYIGNNRRFNKPKDPDNIIYNIITENKANIITESGDLILRDLYSIISEDNKIMVTELSVIILPE